MRQFVRVYIDVATGAIQHVYTQDTPLPPGYEPIDVPGVTYNQVDMELDHPRVSHLRARELLNNIEVVDGQPRLIPGRLPGVVLTRKP